MVKKRKNNADKNKKGLTYMREAIIVLLITLFTVLVILWGFGDLNSIIKNAISFFKDLVRFGR